MSGSFDMVMPFVTCQSEGGPHDDDSFVAGWEAAQVDQLLGSRPGVIASTEHTIMIHTPVVPVVDLIAMRHGWTATNLGEIDDDGPTGWSLVILKRGADDPEADDV